MNNDCGVGGGKSTQPATFGERVMVMMSMMAAARRANLSREKLKKRKEEGRKTLQSVGKVVTLLALSV